MRAVLFLLVWISCAWFGSWEWNPNNAVRMFAAADMVELGTASIDRYAPLTIDKASFAGHAFSDKAPGMTLMAVPAVWIADRVTGDRADRHAAVFDAPDLGRYLRLRTRLAAASGPALLTAIAAVLLFELGLSATGSVGAALFASLGYALGTPAWGWSTTIFGHAAVAAMYVIAAWGVWRGGTRGAVVAGLALGWAVVIEHQAVLAGSAIGVWAVVRWWGGPGGWRWIGAFVAAGLLALVPLLLYNQFAFGTPFRVGYQGVVGWEGMHQGVFGLTLPRPWPLAAILVHPSRGLFWVAPILLPAIGGLMRLHAAPRTQGLARTAIAAVVIGLLVNAAYVYWDGGNSTGPRLSIPIVGLFALGLAPAWAALGRVGRIGAAALLAGSIAWNAAIASAEIMALPTLSLWTAVIRMRFLPGDLRTLPGEWWGWTPWQGFALWAAIALPLLGWLVWQARRREQP